MLVWSMAVIRMLVWYMAVIRMLVWGVTDSIETGGWLQCLFALHWGGGSDQGHCGQPGTCVLCVLTLCDRLCVIHMLQ